MAKFNRNKLLLPIASFILSISLFYYISGEESVEIEKEVYLKLSPPAGMTIIGGMNRELTVTLSASRNLLALLSTKNLMAQYTIEDVTSPGDYSFSLRDRDINLPHGGIKVVEMDPKVLTVTLDEVVSKKLSIQAAIVGEPAAGYVVDHDGILIDPSEVLVEGPESRLGRKKIILTDRIDVTGRIRSFRIKVPLKYSSQYAVVSSREVIDVFVPLRQEAYEKKVTGIPIKVLQAASSNVLVSITPALIDLDLKGPQKILEKIDKKEIDTYVNVADLARGEYQLPLVVHLPQEVSLSGDVPVIQVIVEEKIKTLLPTITPERPSSSENGK